MSRRPFKTQLTLMALLTFASCAGITQRSYLSEMERDDSSFYEPEEDFPVMAGDTGTYGLSERERRARTPASEDEIAEDRSRRFLKKELRDLEDSQNEKGQALYEAHKSKLNTSERIYFLKLPHRDRKDYLESKGLLTTSATLNTSPDHMFATPDAEVILGMGKSDVMGTLGKPRRVEVAGNPNYENERWVYQVNGTTKYIYFESGEVQGWE